MNREIIATGRTVDEALDKAYEQMGISRDEAQFEILDLPKKGFLGLGSTPAKVRVYIEISKAQCAVDYLQSIFHQMGLENVQIDVTESAVSGGTGRQPHGRRLLPYRGRQRQLPGKTGEDPGKSGEKAVFPGYPDRTQRYAGADEPL